MDEAPDPKTATSKCLLSTTLDPDFYRIGHSKASFPLISFQCFMFNLQQIILIVNLKTPHSFYVEFFMYFELSFANSATKFSRQLQWRKKRILKWPLKFASIKLD